MKFIEHPIVLSMVLAISSLGVIGAIWVTVAGYFASEPFSWELGLLAVFWFWAACSSGKSLFRNKSQGEDEERR